MNYKLHKRAIVLLVALVMLVSAQLTAFAATSKTVTANKAMSVTLYPGKEGDSNIVSFDFSSLPEGAQVTEISINATNVTHSGKGGLLAESITVTSPQGLTREVGWGSGNKTTVTGFTAQQARGTWRIYMTAKNISSSNLGARYVGSLKYSSVKMTIKYVV